MAIGVCKHPPKNWGADARAACAKAVAEWAEKKAEAHAKGLIKDAGKS
jgi:hypothetical protein